MSKLACLKRIIDEVEGGNGGLGAKLSAAGRFFVIFLEKLAILMPVEHNLHVFTTILKNYSRFLTCESRLKKLNCSILLFILTI